MISPQEAGEPMRHGAGDCRRPLLILDRVRQRVQGLCGYRLISGSGQEVEEVNEFLDALAARGVSERTLRTYGYCLLNFWRWFSREDLKLETLSETELLGYLRFQHAQKSAAKTINLRLTVVRALYLFCYGADLPSGKRQTTRSSFPWAVGRSADLAHLRPFRARTQRLRVKVPRRLVVPLSPEQVKTFLQSFRTWRDLCLAGLMLLCGLRSRELISTRLENLRLAEGEIRVWGKGARERVVPLSAQLTPPLESYLSIERPRSSCAELFVQLKGPQRGNAMTAAGLRALFRYHRRTSRVPLANPHRFRHTFAAEMVRAGISLPALMKLMGHSTIHHTMLYVELSPEDVRKEFHRAIENLRGRQAELRIEGNA